MEALLQIVGGIGGLVLLYYGAEFLVRGEAYRSQNGFR